MRVNTTFYLIKRFNGVYAYKITECTKKKKINYLNYLLYNYLKLIFNRY